MPGPTVPVPCSSPRLRRVCVCGPAWVARVGACLINTFPSNNKKTALSYPVSSFHPIVFLQFLPYISPQVILYILPFSTHQPFHLLLALPDTCLPTTFTTYHSNPNTHRHHVYKKFHKGCQWHRGHPQLPPHWQGCPRHRLRYVVAIFSPRRQLLCSSMFSSWATTLPLKSTHTASHLVCKNRSRTPIRIPYPPKQHNH